MSKILNNLQEQSIELYKTYRANEITQQEYLTAITPLDHAIEKVELTIFSSALQGLLSSERSSLKRSR